MSVFCENCGSKNHFTRDCTKPVSAVRHVPPPEPVVQKPAPVPAPTGPVFEPGSRFKGCPPICVFANLPCFPTEKDIGKFNEAQCPHLSPAKKWECPKCKGWHADFRLTGDDAYAPPPGALTKRKFNPAYVAPRGAAKLAMEESKRWQERERQKASGPQKTVANPPKKKVDSGSETKDLFR